MYVFRGQESPYSDTQTMSIDTDPIEADVIYYTLLRQIHITALRLPAESRQLKFIAKLSRPTVFLFFKPSIIIQHSLLPPTSAILNHGDTGAA